MSSSYHPQFDGQTEHLNQSMETFLRCFVNACPSKWSSWIALAEFWYNASPHSATGYSPFEALYGYPPRHFGISVLHDVAVPELSTWLQDRQVVTDLIRQHLARAKERMKRQADNNRLERQFKVGDMVFLKIQPYVQSTLAPRANQKLSFKFYGPFQIIARVGSVAYKLELPPTTSIHPVFHVSQLKGVVLPGYPVSPSLPTDTELPQVPLEKLQTRVLPTATGSMEQGLVRWSGWSADNLTCQPRKTCSTFASPSRALLGDKQVLKPRGMSAAAHLRVLQALKPMGCEPALASRSPMCA